MPHKPFKTRSSGILFWGASYLTASIAWGIGLAAFWPQGGVCTTSCGARIPIINIDFDDRDETVEIEMIPKGSGSENGVAACGVATGCNHSVTAPTAGVAGAGTPACAALRT